MLTREKRTSLLLIIILFFYFYSFIFPSLKDFLSPINLYLLPFFWLTLTLYIRSLNKVNYKAKSRYVPNLVMWVFICGFIYVFLYFAAGLMDGFGKNPYNNSFTGFFSNILIYGSVIVMKEMVRHYLINSVRKSKVMIYGLIIVLVYTLVDINPTYIFSLSSIEDIVSFVISKVVVVIALNIFLTYISYLSGYVPCIIYVLLTQLPLWVLEVIPNLTWLSTAVIGIVIPLLGLTVINEQYKKLSRQLKRVKYNKHNLYSWMFTGFLSVCIVWFIVGVFPIAPTVILTGSMEPVIYPGDVCIVKKVNIEEVNIGDVIQYWTGDYFIIHRVVETYEEKGITYYVTKGDNNPSKDSKPVVQEQIKGVHIYTIPKIGKFALMLKSKSDEDINEQIMNSTE